MLHQDFSWPLASGLEERPGPTLAVDSRGDRCIGLSDAGAEDLVRARPGLERLRAANACKLTDTGLKRICGLGTLEVLEISA